MAVRLKTRLIWTHGLLAIMTIFLVVVVTYVLINEHFLDYVTQARTRDVTGIYNQINKTYTDQTWDRDRLEEVGVAALQRGYLVTVTTEKQTVWQATQAGSLYKEKMQEIKQKVIPYWGGRSGVTVKEFKLKEPQGARVIIEYDPTYFLTENDLLFLQHLNDSLLWIAAISFLVAILLSSFTAKRMSRELASLLQAARDLSAGQHNKRVRLDASDIMEIRQLAEAVSTLQDNIKEKEASNKRLTADIAHELRTPLATLQSHLEAMIEGVWRPTTDRLVSCHEEITRMTALVGNLENLKKYDVGLIELKKTKFDLAELVKNIYTNFQADFDKQKIQFLLFGDACMVKADREKLGQVIVNLISNSLKYTPAGGRVVVSTGQDGEYGNIVVNDNGIGIAASDLEHIFDRLYRADVSRTRSTGGAGIGLAVAKAIVEAHQGEITVVSEQDKGTEFTVIIPREG